MLTIQTLRSNPEYVKQRLAIKNFKELDLIDTIIAKDEERRATKTKVEELQFRMNIVAKEIGALIAQNKNDEASIQKTKTAVLKLEINELTEKLQLLDSEQETLLLSLPNLPHSTVPIGNFANDNVIVKATPYPTLMPGALSHWDLAKKHDLIDFDLGTKVSGAGFPFYKGKGAKLQRALIAMFLDAAIASGYIEYQPPLMVNASSARGTGQLPDKEGQMYHAVADDLYLIPTAEVPLTNIYRDVIIEEKELPIKLTGYSQCFRREAGSYGKEVRGLNRLHQFDKVEIVQITHPEKSYEALDTMVDHVENVLVSLELPYRILRLCGGDMSFAGALTYDFEVYSAAQERWLEVSSLSCFETFQSNRMQMRIRGKDKKNILAHTLNGSALALPRIVAALLENHQDPEGIKIPRSLHSYTGFERI